LEIREYIEEGKEARGRISEEEVKFLAGRIADSIKNGGKLVVFGNGGSAADSQHFAAELTGRFLKERGPFPAIALTTNTSALSAIGNDYSFDSVFERQVMALVKENDTVVGISTSGNSTNVIRGIEAANEIGAFTFGMTGKKGGKLLMVAGRTFQAHTDLTPIIQEVHIAFIHLVCMVLDTMI
jgi:D-sedoheptulose 7-phosphate isomerase